MNKKIFRIVKTHRGYVVEQRKWFFFWIYPEISEFSILFMDYRNPLYFDTIEQVDCAFDEYRSRMKKINVEPQVVKTVTIDENHNIL